MSNAAERGHFQKRLRRMDGGYDGIGEQVNWDEKDVPSSLLPSRRFVPGEEVLFGTLRVLVCEANAASGDCKIQTRPGGELKVVHAAELQSPVYVSELASDVKLGSSVHPDDVRCKDCKEMFVHGGLGRLYVIACSKPPGSNLRDAVWCVHFAPARRVESKEAKMDVSV